MNVASVAANLTHQIPSWLGTLALNFDGNIVFSAGELLDDTESASRFAELARCLGQYIALEGSSVEQGNAFKRFTIMCSRHAYVMSVADDIIYVVKRQLSNPDSVEEKRGSRSSYMPVNA